MINLIKVLKGKTIIYFLLLVAGILIFTGSTSAYVLGPTSPGKWGLPTFGTGATITWSYMGSGLTTNGPLSEDLLTFMPAGYTTEIQNAFDAWEAIADIDFIQVADPGVGWLDAGADAVDIRITGHAFDGPNGVLAHAFYPPVNGGAAAGDLHFDSAELWKIGFGGPGFSIFQVMAHELGHSLGLGHETIVTALMNPIYTEAFSGPQADDIAGAQFIYGAPNAIPEPAIMFLLGTGFVVLAGTTKKKFKK